MPIYNVHYIIQHRYIVCKSAFTYMEDQYWCNEKQYRAKSCLKGENLGGYHPFLSSHSKEDFSFLHEYICVLSYMYSTVHCTYMYICMHSFSIVQYMCVYKDGLGPFHMMYDVRYVHQLNMNWKVKVYLYMF